MAETSDFRRFEERYLVDSPIIALVEKIESSTSLNKMQIVLLSCLFVLFCGLVFGNVGRLLCFIIGLVYPAYYSWCAIENSASQDNGERTRWLKYWVVYATFRTGTSITDITFSSVGMYWFMKLMFLIWCILPFTSNGTNYMYDGIITPFVTENFYLLKDFIIGVQQAVMSEFVRPEEQESE